MKPYYTNDAVTLWHGDCLEVMATLPDCSVDSVVTDPPYGLEFMGKEWDSFAPADRKNASVWNGRREGQDGWQEDAAARSGKGGGGPSYRSQHKGSKRCTICGKRAFSGSPCECAEPEWVIEHRQEAPSVMLGFQAWCEQWARECYRILKPGGYMLTFGGTRTSHRLACAVEDAGFEIRDSIAWLYGSGFSKGGLLGNRAGISWCACGENPIPYNHADNTDLPRVRGDVHSSPVPRSEGQNTVLLAPVQRGSEGPRVGETRSQGSGSMVARDGGTGGRLDARREEPGMEGRDVPRTGEGLPDDSDARTSASEGERVRSGAPSRDGSDDRQARHASRRGASHQPEPSGQPAGEPASVPRPHEPLDDGARRGRVGCPRCGGMPNEFRGFSTTLKPAFEPIVVGRKPLVGTVAANVLAYGTGALNIDGCRVGMREARDLNRLASIGYGGSESQGTVVDGGLGRWPANVVLDGSQADALDAQSGDLHGTPSFSRPATYAASSYMTGDSPIQPAYGDSGGASRFFPTFRYEAKAPTSERPRIEATGERADGIGYSQLRCVKCTRLQVDGRKPCTCTEPDFQPDARHGDAIAHPTVKPLDLMRWLVRLVTPPGGTVLEPFAGSGTTAEACILEGFKCIAIEREADYLPLIVQRISKPLQVSLGLDFGGVA